MPALCQFTPARTMVPTSAHFLLENRGLQYSRLCRHCLCLREQGLSHSATLVAHRKAFGEVGSHLSGALNHVRDNGSQMVPVQHLAMVLAIGELC